MNKRLYHHKTDGGAEYLCTAPIEGSDEGDLSTAVIRLDGEPEIIGTLSTPVIVTVEGGILQDVNATDKSQVEHLVIDFDLKECGECPVCHEALDPDETCEVCGYNEATGDALECAIKYLESDEVTS